MGKAIIEQVAEEREKKRKEEIKREEYRRKINELRSRGYVVQRLEKVIDDDLEKLECEFSKYENEIKRLYGLWEKLSGMEIKGFENEYMNIRAKLNNPDELTYIEEKFKELEEKIRKKCEKEKEEELKRRIEYWKAKGYNVSKLERTGDIFGYERELQKLWELGQKLQYIDFEGKDEAIKKLNDPDTIPYLENKIAEAMKKAYETEQEKIKNEIELRNLGIEYVKNVYKRMENYKPDYSPLGSYFERAEYDIALDMKSMACYCKLKYGFFKEPLQLFCSYLEKISLINPNQLNNFLFEIGEVAKMNEQFIARCFVSTPRQSIKDIFKNFSHKNASFYIFDIESSELIYNENDKKTNIFSEWFKVDGKPKDMVEILKSIVDKNGIFKKKGISELGFGEKNCEKLLKNFLERNIIYEVSKRNGEYAFL
ncbi:MAG: hypothetical protein AB1779_01800 [Candidatus Thermoplasmatota archaeon]